MAQRDLNVDNSIENPLHPKRFLSVKCAVTAVYYHNVESARAGFYGRQLLFSWLQYAPSQMNPYTPALCIRELGK